MDRAAYSVFLTVAVGLTWVSWCSEKVVFMILVMMAKTVTATRALAWNSAGIRVGTTRLNRWVIMAFMTILSIEVRSVRTSIACFSVFAGAFSVPRVVKSLCPLRISSVKNSVIMSVVMVKAAQTTVPSAESRRLIFGTVKFAVLVASIVAFGIVVVTVVRLVLGDATSVMVPTVAGRLCSLGWMVLCTVC